jgi:hypothetical protein
MTSLPSSTEPRERALLFLGGMRAADRIASALSAQVMANLIAFEKEKLHEQMGYKRFVEFLDHSPYSPMTKHQFYKRREIFDREGEQVFDLMNDIGLPLARRKMLGRGTVRVEGETVFVNDGSDEEVSIELGNRARILETLSALADANAEKARRLERGMEDYERLKRKMDAGPDAPGDSRDELERVSLTATAMLSALAAMLSETSDARREHFLNTNLNLLALQYRRVNEALGERADEMGETDAVAGLLEE